MARSVADMVSAKPASIDGDIQAQGVASAAFFGIASVIGVDL